MPHRLFAGRCRGLLDLRVPRAFSGRLGFSGGSTRRARSRNSLAGRTRLRRVGRDDFVIRSLYGLVLCCGVGSSWRLAERAVAGLPAAASVVMLLVEPMRWGVPVPALAIAVFGFFLCVFLIAMLVERFGSVLAGNRRSQDDHKSEDCKKSQSIHLEYPQSWIWPNWRY